MEMSRFKNRYVHNRPPIAIRVTTADPKRAIGIGSSEKRTASEKIRPAALSIELYLIPHQRVGDSRKISQSFPRRRVGKVSRSTGCFRSNICRKTAERAEV